MVLISKWHEQKTKNCEKKLKKTVQIFINFLIKINPRKSISLDFKRPDETTEAGLFWCLSVKNTKLILILLLRESFLIRTLIRKNLKTSKTYS